ncbi:response regulator transcription factor [Cytophagaceae bacterium DM2B3-1]|uniref:Response regulator transcription factor n=2 Tax=Xanthocytophaga TaxID=3078918 RepID=A0ABT7CCC8_9BACT|nr:MULTISPECIES: response regulator transcription factor [Xanthocytophaga]MDJ1470108.1 response regulator transcription factor [Xanthocytophaga flavus]MDJ1491329.1 response regulator transcription factor [Xanthocytophaga flavus]MDJ1504503.1 response regulator transcription factor [Xanthocytophaga agilis]
MNITCLIVDDEPNAVNLLQEYIRQIPFLTLSHQCYDAAEVLEYLQTHQVDLIFLDINMPGISGMELTEFLSKGQKIIFTTAYTQYAIESYEKNAIDYLLKPITFKRFSQAIAKLHSGYLSTGTPQVNSDTDYFFVKSGKQFLRLEYDSISYFEGWKEYVSLYTQDSKILVYKRMKELEDSLPDYFQRVHHSYIINIHAIHKIEDNHIYIQEVRIPISEKYRTAFMQIVQQKLL